MLQRCIDVAAGSDVALAIVPAGTSNLLATNLGVPVDIEQAVEIGLDGERRRLDVGRFNGERFAVMAGSGMDATMIRNADGGLKDRLGRAGYVWAGLKAARSKSFGAEIEVDGVGWFRGEATSVLIGNVGELIGHVEVFEDSRPDDGLLEVGVVTAEGYTDWMRTVARTVDLGRRGVAVRASGQGSLGEGEARSKGPLRARRRRSDEGEVVQGQGRARGRHAVRSREARTDEHPGSNRVRAPSGSAKSAGEDRRAVHCLRGARSRRVRRQGRSSTGSSGSWPSSSRSAPAGRPPTRAER